MDDKDEDADEGRGTRNKVVGKEVAIQAVTLSYYRLHQPERDRTGLNV
jgi:hypothetical protein